MVRSDNSWKKFGELDPYFGVLSHDRFRSAQLNAETRKEFFDSGERQVDGIAAIIRKHYHHDFRPSRALDFGCGVGRILVPLSRVAETVVGVDVSPGMLREAARNCPSADLLDDLFRAQGVFDFVHSYIVLQHIPLKRGELLIEKLISLVAQDGIGALHVTYCDTKPAILRRLRETSVGNFLLNIIRHRPLSTPIMRMTTYNLNRVLELIQRGGGNDIHLEFSSHDGFLGCMIFFRKVSIPVLF